jgi:hypothetical protein
MLTKSVDMKKYRIYKCLILSFINIYFTISNVNAQAPNSFNYQGVAIDMNGAVISRKTISLRISLNESSPSGTLRFQEIHTANTGANGQFSIIIGSGQSVTGLIKDVQWGKFPYYLKTEIDLNAGTSYALVGTSQILSVPYAIYANNAGMSSLSDARGNIYAGLDAFKSNTTGFANISIGNNSMKDAESAANNTIMIGQDAGIKIIAQNNIGIGHYVLSNTTSGMWNTGVGMNSLVKNVSGNYNVALGFGTLNKNLGSKNTAVGLSSMFENTTGENNSSFGAHSMEFNKTGVGNTAFGMHSIPHSSSASYNTSIGNETMYYLTTGSENIAIGYKSLYSNKANSGSTAIGIRSMQNSDDRSTGILTANTAIGYESLKGSHIPSNNTGNYNTSVGYQSMTSNTSGAYNVSIGEESLINNTTGYANTAVGSKSLYYNTSGSYNVSVGESALIENTTGFGNAAFGSKSLQKNTIGRNNTAIGDSSMRQNTTGSQNTGLGAFSLSLNATGANNTAIGYEAGSTLTTGSNNIIIGYNAQPSNTNVSNEVTIGNADITKLRSNVTSITSLSDKRDKKNIEPLNIGLEFLKSLKPSTFHWDKREWYGGNISDDSKIKKELSVGFIAQDLDESQQKFNAGMLNLVYKTSPDRWEATYGNLLPVIVKSIQDLSDQKDKEIELLKAQNKLLQDRIGILETNIKMIMSKIN